MHGTRPQAGPEEGKGLGCLPGPPLPQSACLMRTAAGPTLQPLRTGGERARGKAAAVPSQTVQGESGAGRAGPWPARVRAGTHLLGLARGRASSDGLNTTASVQAILGGQGPGSTVLPVCPRGLLEPSQAVAPRSPLPSPHLLPTRVPVWASGPQPGCGPLEPSSLPSPSPWPLPATPSSSPLGCWSGSHSVPYPQSLVKMRSA